MTLWFPGFADAITAHLAATFAGLPVYVHSIEHADGVVLVDTGMIDSTPEMDEEAAPVPMPETSPETSCASSTPTFTSTTAAATAFSRLPINAARAASAL